MKPEVMGSRRSVAAILVLALAALIWSGCATRYAPLGPRGGYSEVRINDDEYLVSFRGNPLLEPDAVQEFLLRRCAELTLAAGGAYFTILADSSTYDIFEQRASRDQPWQTGSSSINQANVSADLTVDTSQSWYTGKYRIHIQREADPFHRYAQFDAAEIVARYADSDK